MAKYLYNGVLLPDINEVWTDKETYPYALISRYNNQYVLYLSPDDYYFLGPWSDDDFSTVTMNNARKHTLNELGDGWNSEPSMANYAVSLPYIVWANFLVKDPWLPYLYPSDPVPVGIAVYMDIGGVRKKVTAYKDIDGVRTLISSAEPTVANYLTFSSAEPFTIGVNNATKNWDGALYYSTDTTTWSEWDGTAVIASAEHGGEQRIYMRGSGNSVITGDSVGRKWLINGNNVFCNGNIENLLDFETVANDDHPAMSNSCYQYMFHMCNALVSAPELPATDLTEYCYSMMFAYCKALVSAPKLPATDLPDGCYQSMFINCTSLLTIPQIPILNGKSQCLTSMFNGCTSIKLSESQTDEYQTEYRIPPIGNAYIVYAAMNTMFKNTGGTFTGTPTINTTYYTSNTVV